MNIKGATTSGYQKLERVIGTVFFKFKYITHKTLTPKDVSVKSLHDLKHVIKGTTKHKGKKNWRQW